jgi:hypothetical protein
MSAVEQESRFSCFCVANRAGEEDRTMQLQIALDRLPLDDAVKNISNEAARQLHTNVE